MAPATARRSPAGGEPRAASTDGDGESPRAIAIPPANARASPITTDRVMGSRIVIGDKTATNSGMVLTRTTALATVVYSREVIQVAKWRARKAPEAAASPRSRRLRDGSELRSRARSRGTTAREATAR